MFPAVWTIAFLLVSLAWGALTFWLNVKLLNRGERVPSLAVVGLAQVTTAMFPILAWLITGRPNPHIWVPAVVASFALGVAALWLRRDHSDPGEVHPAMMNGLEGPTLYITRGLPASGKTTVARDRVAKALPGLCRINRDDTRAMMHGGWQKDPETRKITEQQVTAATHAAIGALLAAGVPVICDDTNLDSAVVATLGRLAQRNGAKVCIIDMRDVPLTTCLERNAQRTGDDHVPEDVIIRMHADHIMDVELRRLK